VIRNSAVFLEFAAPEHMFAGCRDIDGDPSGATFVEPSEMSSGVT